MKADSARSGHALSYDPPLPSTMPFHLLRNAIREYDWGSHTALAELQDRPVPSVQPEAELWIGAHPRAPSEVRIGGKWRSLQALIAEAPTRWLGAASLAAGAELPFLLKVIAAERPLSLQLHPDADTARRGFAREEAAGVALDAPTRSYPDPNPKPEVLVALTPFEGLCGLRAREDAARLGSRLGLARWVALLAEDRAPGEILTGLLADRDRVAPLLDEALAAAAGADPDAELCWVARLAEAFPGDAGALAPLLMHRVVLAPGQAVFLRPRRLHAYLAGVGVELMASSDNVLRAGLTSKHIDLGELRAVMEADGAAPDVLEAESWGSGERGYATPTDAFRLSVLQPVRGGEVTPAPAQGAELLLCTEGRAELLAEGAPPQSIARGEAVFVEAGAPRYRVRGGATLYRATAGVPL